ncbi:MAG: ATP-binding protein [Chloroflexota bacterium]
MMRQLFGQTVGQQLNKLWVRFSLMIIAIIFVVTVLPAGSLLFTDPIELTYEEMADLRSLNETYELGLTGRQIRYIADQAVDYYQYTYLFDFQFLAVTTLIIGIVAGILLGRGMSLPIERLVKATQAVASQQLNHRIEVSGAQEINELAANFNQMVESLEHSEQLRRNLIADVSHELLTPLTVLQGNLRAMLDDVYEPTKDELGKLYVQNKHLIRLVKDLRLLSQAEAGQLPLQKTAVNLNILAQETVDTFAPLAAEKNVPVTFQPADNLPLLQADAARLRQVLHNLLANALRHTPRSGQITVAAEYNEDTVSLFVKDNGDGIAPDALPHLFDRFYRAADGQRRDSGGAGLGLPIAKAIVEGHNGRLLADSDGLGQGCTMTISFPIAK